MSIEGQGHFFTIYFPGFVCFVLYWAKISGERLQDHWSSGFEVLSPALRIDFKFSVGLKSRLHQGLSEPEFYDDLVYKFKKIMGRTDFADQFRKIIIHHKLIGYDLNVMRQSACLVINQVTVNNFAALFNCTPVDRASDSMMAPT